MYKKIMPCLLLLNLTVEAEMTYSDEDDFFAFLMEEETANKNNANYISYADTSAKNCDPCRKAEITPSWPYDTCGFILSGDFLWWKVDEAGLDYAFSKNFPVLQYTSSSQPASGLAGKEHRGTFKWSPGFRVGLGYQFANTPWTLQAEYTRFTSENTNKAHVPAFNGVQTFTTANPDGSTSPASAPISTLNNTTSGFLETSPEKARSHLNFKYNLVDLNFIKHLFSNSSFVLSPYFGVEGAFINQKWNVKYYSFPFIGSVPVTIANRQTYASKWDFKGGGIDVGVNIDWYWGAGFSCYATAAAAAFYGTYHHSLSAKTTPAYVDVYQDVSEKECRTAQRTQLSAGIEWSYSCSAQAFSLFAGWEFNTLYNLMQNYRFAEAGSTNATGLAGGNTIPTYSKPRALDKSDIHLQGLTVGAKWLF